MVEQPVADGEAQVFAHGHGGDLTAEVKQVAGQIDGQDPGENQQQQSPVAIDEHVVQQELDEHRDEHVDTGQQHEEADGQRHAGAVRPQQASQTTDRRSALRGPAHAMISG